VNPWDWLAFLEETFEDAINFWADLYWQQEYERIARSMN
jgi:hypothetical protein